MIERNYELKLSEFEEERLTSLGFSFEYQLFEHRNEVPSNWETIYQTKCFKDTGTTFLFESNDKYLIIKDIHTNENSLKRTRNWSFFIPSKKGE